MDEMLSKDTWELLSAFSDNGGMYLQKVSLVGSKEKDSIISTK